MLFDHSMSTTYFSHLLIFPEMPGGDISPVTKAATDESATAFIISYNFV